MWLSLAQRSYDLLPHGFSWCLYDRRTESCTLHEHVRVALFADAVLQDSCSATPYRVYGLVRDDILDANGSSSSDSSQVDLLRHFECLCRDKRGLVNIDIERRQLWLFGDEEKMRKLLLEIGIDGDETQTTVTEVDGMKIQSTLYYPSNTAEF